MRPTAQSSDFVASMPGSETLWYVLAGERRKLSAAAVSALFPHGQSFPESEALADFREGAAIGPDTFLARSPNARPIYLVVGSPGGQVRHLIANERYIDGIGLDRAKIRVLEDAVLRGIERGGRLDKVAVLAGNLLPPPMSEADSSPPPPEAIDVVSGVSRAADLRPCFVPERPLLLLLAQPSCEEAIRFAGDVAHAVRRGANTLIVTRQGEITNLTARSAHGSITIPLEGESEEDLLTTLRGLDVTRAEVFTLAGQEDDWAGRLVTAASAPYDVTFVGIEEVAGGKRPLPRYIMMAERRKATSRALAAVLNQKWRGLNSVAVHPPELDEPTKFQVTFPPISDAEPLRILLLGQPAAERALADVLATTALARRRKSPLQFFLIGREGGVIEPKHQGDDRLVHLGAVESTRLNAVLSKVRPHLAWFPYSKPPMFDRLISEAALNGLPILAADLGSAREQLEGRPLSWLADARAKPDEWLALLLKLRETRLTEGPSATEGAALPPLDVGHYLNGYIDRLYEQQ